MQDTIVMSALNFLETIIAYYRNLPPDSLPQIIGTLCKVVNHEPYCQMSWKVMKNLLGTHLGHAALFTMCRILQAPDLAQNTFLFRGAIFFIQMGLWGNPVPSLRCPASAVLPAIYEAVHTNQSSIVFEVVICVQKLVQKCGVELQEPSWDIILKMLAVAVRHGNCFAPLNDTLNIIEQLIEDGHFNGRVESVYAIVAACAQNRPEASIMRLIGHLSDDIHPVRHAWLMKLNDLLQNYYRVEKERRTNVRLKALDVLVNVVQLHRVYFEDEIIDKVVIPHFLHLHLDGDYKIRSAGASLLIRLCTTCESRRCSEMLDILERLINRPFDISAENQPASDTDTADVKATISQMITLFETKIHKLPSSPAVRIYKILMSHLEVHYTRPRVFENCNFVRWQIFDGFLRMRADDRYHIGCPRNGELKFSPYLCVAYTSPSDRSALGSPPPNSPAANVQQPSATQQTPQQPLLSQVPCAVTYVTIKSAFKIFITCLTCEKDMEVLMFVLKRLPDVLQNKSLVLTRHGNNDVGLLIEAVCKLMKYPLDNTSVNRIEFYSLLLLILSGLASYHACLHHTHQQEMIRLLSTCKVRHGVPCFSQCIRALTTCTLDMQDVMVKILPEVLLQLSKTTATAPIAMPMLEFLSTLTILPSVFSNFVGDQYMAIFAMLLPYTNPFNYHAYTVFLAHHLIAVWFLKCRLTFRKDFVSYITNGLHTNALTPSPPITSKVDVNKLNQDSSNRKRSSSLTEQSSRKRERSATLVSKPAFDVPRAPPMAPIDKTLQFYRELTETCIDLMARYTFSPCSALPKRLPNAEFLFGGGQSMSWLLGNRVVTITTSGCAQKALKHGLCDKCYGTCKGGGRTPYMQRTGSSETSTMDRIARQNSGSNTNTSTSSPTEDARRFSDRLEQLPNKLQQLAATGDKREHCACWCQNWAEIHVRRPTGNMSWVMRIQNQTSDTNSVYDFPLNDICTLFMPSLHTDHTVAAMDSIEKETQDVAVGTVGPVYNTQPISIPGSPSKQSPSRQSSRDSIDEEEDLDGGMFEDGSRSRNPVRRSNSSPEMSAGWKNPFLMQQHKTSAGGIEREERDEEHAKKKSTSYAKDNRVSCEAIPEEIAGMGTTPPSSDASSGHSTHPALLSSLSCPGPEQEVPAFVSKGYSSTQRPTLNLPVTGKPPQSPTQTSPRLPRHALNKGHEIQKSSSLVLQKQKVSIGGVTGSSTSSIKLDGFNQSDQKRDRATTISVMQSPARKARFGDSSSSSSSNLTSAPSSSGKSKDMPKSGINPAFVFLQLYHAAQFGSSVEKPLLINTSEVVVQRALQILDIIQPYETHKIGVLYVGPGQCNREADILRNCYGSLRYVDFLKRLGTMIKVQDVDPQAFFLGGLDHDGGDGSYAYMWQDDIIRVIFHVATLMPNSEFEPNCNHKKKHIGNDYVTIVYNESGEDYNINTIKGQFNFASIIIQPLDHNSNKVTVKAKDAIVELIGQSEARVVSDQNVALLARQLALHANVSHSSIIFRLIMILILLCSWRRLYNPTR